MILTLGPVVLVTFSYVVAAPLRAPSSQLLSTEISSTDSNDFNSDEPLVVRCEAAASSLKLRLPQTWSFVVQSPFILGGDSTTDKLIQLYQETIVPTSTALQNSYFRQMACHPITILICSTDDEFRECNLRLEAQKLNQYSGLYSRKHRRVIVNIASGEGTLAHELTHALAHADFPTMPEWFDEGLASLHEECEFSSDGLRLIGNENWRNQVAVDALNRGELRLIEDVTSKRFGSTGRANLDYAHVRTICLYLQDADLLASFYKTCRANSEGDPTGLRSLCEVAGAAFPRAFDDAFQAWMMTRYERKQK